MKISFVIPAFNEEKLISYALASIIEQITGSGHEIIVVNNASTDRTARVAMGFRYTQVIDEPTKGLTQARKTGLEKASGDLIFQIDADCRLGQGQVKRVIREFTEDPELVALSGPYRCYDSSGTQDFWIRIFYYFSYFAYLVNRFLLRRASMIQGGNVVIRKSALKDIQGYDTRIPFYGEDADLARRLMKVGKIKFSLSFYNYSSARRMNHEGLWKIGIRYAWNYLSVVFKGRPASHDYLDIRN